jgi:uncharacterized damage-inducible protein DinB
MKQLRFLLAMLAVFLAAKTVAQTNVNHVVEEWQRAKDYTKEYLEAMPEDGYTFKPTPEMRSFASQMLHLADGNYFFASTASAKPNPLGQTSAEKEVPQTKAAVIKSVMDSYDFVISCIQTMNPSQMQEMTKFPGNGKEYSKLTLLNKGFEHQTHHRGQTTVYLRLKGVKPPAERLF